MNKLLYLALTLLLLTSCTRKYKVEGTSSVTSLDGKMAFIKIIKNNELVKVDSGEVIHGKFSLTGKADSTLMGTLFIGDQSIMPIVIERGTIKVTIDMAEQKVSGTPLNEKLYSFIEKKNQFDARAEELSHKESQMIMDGKDPAVIQESIMMEAKKLNNEAERMETDFITSNFDNVLATGVFMILSSGYPYPVITPQIDEIMSKAPASFKDNSYVKDYMSAAQENLRRMQMQQQQQAPADGFAAPANSQSQQSPISISGAPTYMTE